MSSAYFFCLVVWLSVWLAGCLEIIAFIIFLLFQVEILGPQGPYKGPQRGPLLVKTIFKLKITPRLGLLRSFQLFESAALWHNFFIFFDSPYGLHFHLHSESERLCLIIFPFSTWVHKRKQTLYVVGSRSCLGKKIRRIAYFPVTL